MKHPLLMAITVFLLLGFHLTPYSGPFAATPASSEQHSEEAKEKEHDSKKQQIMEDAQKLGEDFLQFFSDLTQLSKETIAPLAETITGWITDNYAKLSEDGREKLKDFLAKLKEEYKDIEEMSLETFKKIMESVTEFFKELKKGNDTEPDEPLQKTSEKTEI